MSTDDLPSPFAIEVERTANNARILEVIFGALGAFGMGWLYTGNMATGIIILALSIFLVVPIELGLIIGTAGICACLFLPVNAAIGYLSGNNARAWALTNRKTQGSIMNVILGFVVFLIAGVIIATLLGTLLAGILGGLTRDFLPEFIPTPGQ